jgi:hypothetical protein
MHTYEIIYDIILESYDDYEHDDEEDHREEESLEALAYRHFAC